MRVHIIVCAYTHLILILIILFKVWYISMPSQFEWPGKDNYKL